MWAKYHGIESYINCFFFEKKGEFDANTNATSIYLGEDYFTFTIVHENEQSQKLHNFLARRCSNKNG